MGEVVRVDFEVRADPERLLSGPEVAALLGIGPAGWRIAVKRGYAPPPDDPGPDGPPNTRRPRWRLAAVRQYKLTRKGRGFRSDLGPQGRREEG